MARSSSLLFSSAVIVTDVTLGLVVKGVRFGDLITAEINKTNSEILATIKAILLDFKLSSFSECCLLSSG